MLKFNNPTTGSLEKHIQSYVQELEQNRLEESIFNCPLNIFQDYCNVLDDIDICIPEHLLVYVALAKEVACWCTGRFQGLDVWHSQQILYIFDIIPLQQGVHTYEFQSAIQSKLPEGYYVQALDQTFTYNSNEVTLRILITNGNKPI